MSRKAPFIPNARAIAEGAGCPITGARLIAVSAWFHASYAFVIERIRLHRAICGRRAAFINTAIYRGGRSRELGR